MRNNFLILFVIVLSFSILPVTAQVGILVGEFDDNTQKLPYFQPIKGKFFYGAINIDEVKRNGHFRLKIKSSHPGFIYLPHSGVRTNVLFYQPNMRTKIVVKDQQIIDISGDYVAENELLQTIDRLQYPTALTKFNIADTLFHLTPDQAYQEWQKRLNADIVHFETYCQENNCDSFFLEALKTDHTYFYINSFTRSLLGKVPVIFKRMPRAQMNKEQTAKVDSFFQHWGSTWEKIMQSGSPQDHAFYSVEYCNYLTRFYIGWYLGKYKDVYEPKDYLNHGKDYFTYSPYLATKYLSGSALEAFMAFHLELAWRMGPTMYTKASIKYFDQLKEAFPTSSYLPYLQETADKVIRYVAHHAEPSSDIEILDDEYDSWQQLLNKFEGHILYIDLWATWCAPCIAEFEHNEALQKLANQYDMKLLYISQDQAKHKAKWEKMISKLDLKGTHLIARPTLKEIIWEQIRDEGVDRAIPRYLLIDDLGNFVSKNAPRPSEIDKIRILIDAI